MKKEQAQQGIKDDPDNPAVKEEPDAVPDCYIDRIDYSRKLPDFKVVPIEVIKSEL